MITSGIYLGTIQEVYPPSHELNPTGGYQYVYEVAIVTDLVAYLPVKCVKMDSIGGLYNYDDIILSTGQQVYVGFPFKGDTSLGIILGSSRQEETNQDEEGPIRWKKRLNQINESVSFEGVWKIGHVSEPIPTQTFLGPNITLDKDVLLIDDGGVDGSGNNSQSVEVDARNRTIKINSGEWTLQAESGVTINVSAGDVNVSCLNAKVEAKQSVNVKASAGPVSVESGSNVSVKANGQASIEATQVLLNSKGLPLDGVLTTKTQPTCYVTGIPFRGSTKVLAGE